MESAVRSFERSTSCAAMKDSPDLVAWANARIPRLSAPLRQAVGARPGEWQDPYCLARLLGRWIPLSVSIRVQLPAGIVNLNQAGAIRIKQSRIMDRMRRSRIL